VKRDLSEKDTCAKKESYRCDISHDYAYTIDIYIIRRHRKEKIHKEKIKLCKRTAKSIRVYSIIVIIITIQHQSLRMHPKESKTETQRNPAFSSQTSSNPA
jgi:hypothetical protein